MRADAEAALGLFPLPTYDLRIFAPKSRYRIVSKVKTLYRPYSFLFDGELERALKYELAAGFDVLHLDEIVSFAVRSNLQSTRVMEKIGMSRDPAEDFDHPLIPEGHTLRRHVLYRMSRGVFSASPAAAHLGGAGGE